MSVKKEILSDEHVYLNIGLKIPRFLYNFIFDYCEMANLDPSSFFYSLLLHSLEELLKDHSRIIGVRLNEIDFDCKIKPV